MTYCARRGNARAAARRAQCVSPLRNDPLCAAGRRAQCVIPLRNHTLCAPWRQADTQGRQPALFLVKSNGAEYQPAVPAGIRPGIQQCRPESSQSYVYGAVVLGRVLEYQAAVDAGCPSIGHQLAISLHKPPCKKNVQQVVQCADSLNNIMYFVVASLPPWD